MASASELGIHPPSTVRIAYGEMIHDWPHHCIVLEGDRVQLKVPFGRPGHAEHTAVITWEYEHARELAPGLWIFHGAEDFTITAGPDEQPSMDTRGPARPPMAA